MTVTTMTAGELTVPRRESPVQRAVAAVLGRRLFWALFLSVSFGTPLVRSLFRQLPTAPPVLGTLSAFHLVDQYGRPFDETGTRGRILVAELTSAERDGAASPLEALQKRVRNTGDAVLLVSFVGVEEGTSAREAAERLAASAHPGAGRWTIAAGDTTALAASLGEAVGKEGLALEGKLLLVDGQGRLRRFVEPLPDQIDLLMRDISILANVEPGGPQAASPSGSRALPYPPPGSLKNEARKG